MDASISSLPPATPSKIVTGSTYAPRDTHTSSSSHARSHSRNHSRSHSQPQTQAYAPSISGRAADDGDHDEEPIKFVLLAEFDIDAGATLAQQYPFPTGTDEQSVAASAKTPACQPG